MSVRLENEVTNKGKKEGRTRGKALGQKVSFDYCRSDWPWRRRRDGGAGRLILLDLHFENPATVKGTRRHLAGPAGIPT